MLKRIQISEHFFLDEFIDAYTYFNSPDNGLSLIDNKVIEIAEFIREKYNKPLYANTWWNYYKKNWNKKNINEIIEFVEKPNNYQSWRGIRTERCTIGASQSAHKLIKGRNKKGMALDLAGNSKELQNIVLKNLKSLYQLGLRRIEDISLTPTWLHFDIWELNVEPNSIRIVTKYKGKNIAI